MHIDFNFVKIFFSSRKLKKFSSIKQFFLNLIKREWQTMLFWENFLFKFKFLRDSESLSKASTEISTLSNNINLRLNFVYKSALIWNVRFQNFWFHTKWAFPWYAVKTNWAINLFAKIVIHFAKKKKNKQNEKLIKYQKHCLLKFYKWNYVFRGVGHVTTGAQLQFGHFCFEH